MKTITLNIDQNVFEDMAAALRQKRLEQKFGGVLDMFCLAVVTSVENNQPSRSIRYKEKTAAPLIRAWGK